MMRRLGLLAVALITTAAFYAIRPARTRDLGSIPPNLGAPVRGVMHVHTRQSDGGGTIEQVAAAASRAGLQFVIVTDHGDATRPPQAPAYRSGVLCIDAVEISTSNGHLVAVGVPQAPYPLGGEARDVIDDVARLGGFSIAAHPVTPKSALRWTEWTAPIGGIEWLNGDSEWRDESRWMLAKTLATYFIRPVPTLGALLDRPEEVLRRWDGLTADRRVVGIAGSDAHARLGLPDEQDPPRLNRTSLPLPGYAQVFRTFSLALPGAQLTGRADADAREVIDQIRHGHVYTVVDSFATPGAVTFSATSGRFRAQAGDVLGLDGPVHLRVDAHAPPDAHIALIRNGERLTTVTGAVLDQTVEARPAVYRVEVDMPGAPGRPPVPWVLTNPIYVGWPEERDHTPGQSAAAASLPLDRNIAAWTVEHSEGSDGAVNAVRVVGGRQRALFRYALSGPMSVGPYAALVVPVPSGFGQHDRVTFTVHADRPMRVSVQLRAPGDRNGERWHRSVYVGTEPRDVSVFLADARPRGATRTSQPPVGDLQSVLFVVDTINAKSGTSGQVWIENLRAEH